MFSLLQTAYCTGHPEGSAHKPFRMPRGLLQELLLLASLGSLATTELKVQTNSKVYATDASPDGAGIVCADVGQDVTAELAGGRTRGGFTPDYCRLQEQPCKKLVLPLKKPKIGLAITLLVL